MVYFVLMSMTVSDDKNNDFFMDHLIDFGSEENYEIFEGDNFDNTLHIINAKLPYHTYISDEFPEPVTIYGDVNIDKIDLSNDLKENIIKIPFSHEL